MTLKSQLTLFVVLLLSAVLGATFWLNLDSTRSFLQNQLEVHAQDTATSLGITLSHAVEPDDAAMMETFINAVFDRGYYLEITLVSPDGKVLYQRTNPLTIEGVPDWFTRLIDLHPSIGVAEVVAGWIPVGEIRVTSHPGYAYGQLWDSFVSLVIIFLLLGTLAVAAAWGYLSLLLRPLRTMVRQAEAIVQKRYIFQDSLPGTLELRRLVEAMNAMVGKLRAIFEREARINERLQKMAYADETTGLGNRAYFDMVFESVLTDETEPYAGALAILRFEDLQAINRAHGYPTGDKAVQALGEALADAVRSLPGAVLARLNGSDFAILAPQAGAAQLTERLEPLHDLPRQLTARLGIDADTLKLHAGITDYAHRESRSSVLARANEALQQARANGRFSYVQLAHPPANDALVNQVIDAVSKGRLQLLAQPAMNEARTEMHDLELLSQLLDENGQPIAARHFIALLTELDLEMAFDRLVIEQAIARLKGPVPAPLAINLTPSVLHNASFQQWLLAQIPHEHADRLAFEIPEHFLKAWPESCERFISAARQIGCLIGFDHFGRQLSEKETLRHLQPDYIKLPLGFSAALQSEDERTLSYLASLIEMARNLDIEVIATGIESEALQNAYDALGITWYQGYHVHQPDTLDRWLTQDE